MKNILVIGAGQSSSALVRYLLDNAHEQGWFVELCDQNLGLAREKIRGHDRGEALSLDAHDEEKRRALIQKADLVISMLPARMHIGIARDCIQLKKDIITPSYISEEMQGLDDEARNAGVLIMNEIGVDPGIDHMSAMRVLDRIREEPGKELTCFESFTGGLVAPENDNNPWGYKFTWNPRNVVLAGQGGAVKFIQEGRYKYIPSYRVFKRSEPIEIEGYGKFEGYPNRDSLHYRSIYGLEDIPTIFRGTLRRPGFCRAWDVFVQLGATDDSYIMEGSEEMTHREFINSFLVYNPSDSVELKLMHYLQLGQDSDVMQMLDWLGIFEDRKIGLRDATPAQILQHILEQKWVLEPDDKDMIVMYHKFNYLEKGEEREIRSSMVHIGQDSTYTAMANTVGLPVGIIAKMVINGQIQEKGVRLPTLKSVYEPVLNELEDFDINFVEKEVEPSPKGTFSNSRFG